MKILKSIKLRMQTIGEIIKQRRKKLNMTQIELAQKANVAQSNISQLESGVSDNVSLMILRSLAKALNCAVIDLLPEEDKRH